MKTPVKKLVMTLICCAASMSGASAHAFLDHADPLVGSRVKAPTEIKIWFTEGIILPFSEIKVTNTSGKEVQKADKHLDPAHNNVLIVSLQRLQFEKYKVSWRVTALDTHVTSGFYMFEVAQ
jgi:methionine-rich copper-binding protein CopC